MTDAQKKRLFILIAVYAVGIFLGTRLQKQIYRIDRRTVKKVIGLSDYHCTCFTNSSTNTCGFTAFEEKERTVFVPNIYPKKQKNAAIKIICEAKNVDN